MAGCIFLKHVCILLALECFGLPIVQSDSTGKELRKYLEQFKMNRHHLNSDGKKHARDFIRETFDSFGLHTWMESFVPSPPSTKVATGINVIGMLPGKLARTRDDRLILIGSHYDTMRNTSEGADDNGSGVAALLQVAKLLTSKSDQCTREYSVMFVAFDFEEWEDSSLPGCACAKLGCGSRAFVSNFSLYYNLFPNMSVAPYGQLQGAIIMDTMMNYNSTPDSQEVPLGLEAVFPEQYNTIANNSFRGDFLIAVGRYAYDVQLLNTFSYYYNKDRPKYKLSVFRLPFDGQPSRLMPNNFDRLSAFLRSDHISIWNGNTSGRAIFLSDTANMRSYMKKCYHKDCDSVSRVTDDFLFFLSKSCDTIAMTTDDLTKAKCKTSPSYEESSELPVGGSMTIGMLLGSIMGFFGSYCCCIRKKSEDELVENEERNWSTENPVFEGRESERTRTGNQEDGRTTTGSAGTGRPSTASGSLETGSRGIGNTETGSRGTGNKKVKNEVPKPKDSAEPNIYEAVGPGERWNENEASGRSPGLREPGKTDVYATRGSGTGEDGEDVLDSMA